MLSEEFLDVSESIEILMPIEMLYLLGLTPPGLLKFRRRFKEIVFHTFLVFSTENLDDIFLPNFG
jgi:hypothetical protein